MTRSLFSLQVLLYASLAFDAADHELLLKHFILKSLRGGGAVLRAKRCVNFMLIDFLEVLAISRQGNSGDLHYVLVSLWVVLLVSTSMLSYP